MAGAGTRPPRAKPTSSDTPTGPPMTDHVANVDLARADGADERAAESSLRVVTCGASAGGLEAFSQLLASLPADLDAGVVFVQHLSPEHESMLPSLLQHHTKMPVVQATDGVRMERAHVYVAPP